MDAGQRGSVAHHLLKRKHGAGLAAEESAQDLGPVSKARLGEPEAQDEEQPQGVEQQLLTDNCRTHLLNLRDKEHDLLAHINHITGARRRPPSTAAARRRFSSARPGPPSGLRAHTDQATAHATRLPAAAPWALHRGSRPAAAPNRPHSVQPLAPAQPPPADVGLAFIDRLRESFQSRMDTIKSEVSRMCDEVRRAGQQGSV